MKDLKELKMMAIVDVKQKQNLAKHVKPGILRVLTLISTQILCSTQEERIIFVETLIEDKTRYGAIQTIQIHLGKNACHWVIQNFKTVIKMKH